MRIRDHKKESHTYHMPNTHLAIETSDDIIQPKRPTNPVQESPSRQSLHRELLFNFRRGALLGQRPELLKILEQRRLEQVGPPPTDLEKELRRRKQRLQECEQELGRKEQQEKVPEFLRVRENLRHVHVSEQ
ncbi:hypothetical protein GJAV_G00171640 [Gymnothorax javanicus]|nr:hypothetical protein GJAV_G00171640 [Gymnothorax javanicus]